MGTSTTNFGLYAASIGETGWGSLVNANWTIIDNNLVTVLLRDYLAGCNLSNNTAAPTTTVDISVGQAQDAASGGLMVLASTLSKAISGAWVVGTGQNGLGTGVSLTANTTYHVYLIKRTDTGVVDAYFDTSTSAANIPANYTLFRRLGSVLTGQANTLARWAQDGDYFQLYDTPTNFTGTTTTGARRTITLTSTPLGVSVMAHLVASVDLNAANETHIYTNMAQPDLAPDVNANNTIAAGVGGFASMVFQIRTSLTQGIGSRGTTLARTERVRVLGWWDTRGRFN